MRKPPRWGLRTLGFLVLSIVALVVYGVRGYHTLASASCTFIGIIGAAYCTVRGLVAMIRLESRAFLRR